MATAALAETETTDTHLLKPRVRQKLVVLHRSKTVDKVLRQASGLRLVAIVGCVFGVVSSMGCASTMVSQSPKALIEVSVSRARDYMVTSEYLRARAEALRMTMAALPLNASSAEVVIARARSECAGALRGTPATAAVDGGVVTRQVIIAGMLDLEINGSILGRWARITDKAPLAASAAHTFSAKVALLHWANPQIANLARALIEVEAQLFAIPAINVCQMIRGWVAGGYKSYPGDEELVRPHGAVGRAWLRALLAVGCQGRVRPIQATLLAVLRSYERPNSGLTTRQIEKLETRLWAGFKTAQRVHIKALWRVLGLPEPPRTRVDREPITPPPLPDCVSVS